MGNRSIAKETFPLDFILGSVRKTLKCIMDKANHSHLMNSDCNTVTKNRFGLIVSGFTSELHRCTPVMTFSLLSALSLFIKVDSGYFLPGNIFEK